MKFDIDFIAHNNRLTDFNAYIKVIASVALMVITLILDNLAFDTAVFILMAILVLVVARISLKNYIKFLTIPIVFAVITCVFLIFFFGHGPLIYDTGLWGIGITKSSLNLGITTFCRCFACFSCLGFLTLTTPIADILQCLYKVKVPVIFIDIALLMYNTIFIFLDQLNTMRNAQNTRLGYVGTKAHINHWACCFQICFSDHWTNQKRSNVPWIQDVIKDTCQFINQKEEINNVKGR